MSVFFFEALNLRPSGTLDDVKKSRPLTLQIEIKPVQVWDNTPWTPKTPCSMLSPLTPKLRLLELTDDSVETVDDERNSLTQEKRSVESEKDPTLSLMMIDLTSPLGRRLTNTLLSLLILQPCNVTKDYDAHCNRSEQSVDPDARRLRSLEGNSHERSLELPTITKFWI